MATVALTGAIRASSPSPSNLRKEKPHHGLAFSSSALAGHKIHSSSAFLTRQRRSQAPIVVCPKAVSDSKNSQTCLDPEASRGSQTAKRKACCKLTCPTNQEQILGIGRTWIQPQFERLTYSGTVCLSFRFSNEY